MRSFHLVSPTISGNALGRTLCLATVARELGSATVWAPLDGAIWSGAAQFDFSVRPLSRQALAQELERDSARSNPIVWITKGTPPLQRLFRKPLGARHWRYIVDFDDNDAELAFEFASASFGNRLRINLLRGNTPIQIRRAQRFVASQAHARTVASLAVGRVSAGGRLPTLLVPHARTPLNVRREPTDAIRIGFLGTLRSHKGLQHLLRLLDADDALRLVTFDQDGLPPRTDIVRIPPHTRLADAYSEVDVLLIPSDRTSASEVQLPAKLIDALVSRTPILATETSAIREIAADQVTYVEDWSDTSRVLRLLRQALQNPPDFSTLTPLTPAALAEALDIFLQELCW